MKTISFAELIARPDFFVREAALETTTVTEFGAPLIVIKPARPELSAEPTLRSRPIAERPQVDVDSWALLSEDRDRG